MRLKKRATNQPRYVPTLKEGSAESTIDLLFIDLFLVDISEKSLAASASEE